MKPRPHALARPILIASIALCCALSCAPKAKTLDSPLVKKLEAGKKRGESTLDHSALDALLAAHVDEEAGRVDYTSLRKEKAKLDAYLTTLANADATTLGEDEQKAMLINAYNGYTLALVLEHYPDIESIKDIDAPWDQVRWRVAGHTLSLNQIEHGLLRPLYKDPRVHFAVNCASVGCPVLRERAYRGEDLDARLEEVTRDALTSSRNVRVRDGEIALTRIMSWFKEDFTFSGYRGHAPSVEAYVARYNEEVARAIEKGDPKVASLDYDWSLNDVK